MILNPDKCYFLTLGFQDAQPNFSYDTIKIKSLSEEKIISIAIDNFTFKSHLKKICKKANQKFDELVRILSKENFVEFLHKALISTLSSSLDVYI